MWDWRSIAAAVAQGKSQTTLLPPLPVPPKSTSAIIGEDGTSAKSVSNADNNGVLARLADAFPDSSTRSVSRSAAQRGRPDAGTAGPAGPLP